MVCGTQGKYQPKVIVNYNKFMNGVDWITSNFAADAWNALPLSLRDVPTLSQFKRGIKKALF